MPISRFYRLSKIGLALSGGGARGLAHIGVLKVLKREGIPIHCLAGTSAGGIIAAGYAAGLTVEELEQEALRMSRLRNLVTLVDAARPRIGLFAGQRVQEYFSSKIGYKDFAELTIPLALVAVDLQSGEEVILDSGSVIEALRATISLPGVFQPCEIAGRLLVDGGLLNNLPADVPRKMGADVVIAVDVSAGMDDLASFMEEARQSYLLPQVHLTVEMLTRCLGIMMDHIRHQKLASSPPDVLIRPEIDRGIGLFTGFTRAAECIAAGEKAANDALPEIRELLKPRLRF